MGKEQDESGYSSKSGVSLVAYNSQTLVFHFIVKFNKICYPTTFIIPFNFGYANCAVIFKPVCKDFYVKHGTSDCHKSIILNVFI